MTPYRRSAGAQTWRHRVCIALVFCFGLVPRVEAATATYSYDALGRLTQVDLSNGVVVKYTYDNAGNRTMELVTGAKALSVEQKAAVVTLILQLILDD